MDRRYSAREMELIRRGALSESMDEHWNMLFDNNQLLMHRSWTGVLCFIVEFEPFRHAWSAVAVRVNRVLSEIGGPLDRQHAKSALTVLDGHFLGKRRLIPVSARADRWLRPPDLPPPDTARSIAALMLLRGEASRALGLLDQLRSETPDDPWVLCHRGCALVELGRYGEGLAEFDAACASHAEDPALVDMLHCQRALTLIELERWRPALEDLNELLRVHPKNVAAIHNRSLVIARLEACSDA